MPFISPKTFSGLYAYAHIRLPALRAYNSIIYLFRKFFGEYLQMSKLFCIFAAETN